MTGLAKRMLVCALGAALQLMPPAASAQQKSEENAVTDADDAFGTSVGLESTGVYSERNVRGFSPLDAGNARLDGIYFDPVSLVTLRVRASQSMRVGYAALDYPFAAPTGIVDNSLRSAGNDFGVGAAFHLQQYGSYIGLADAQIPVIDDHLAVAAGASAGHAVFVDGATEDNVSYAVKPVITFAGIEISPFYSINQVRNGRSRPFVILRSEFVPDLPEKGRYFGTPWALKSADNSNWGSTLKASVTDRLSLRAGLFKSTVRRPRNFIELFNVSNDSGQATHILIAEPDRKQQSWSGEAQLAYALGSGNSRHRFIAGYRARDRLTETGGSDIRNFGQVTLGEPDDETPVEFQFGPIDRGTVKQSAMMLGYLGKIEGLGLVNLGIQRADFRGRFQGQFGETRSREKLWLYNASIGVELGAGRLVYAGTQRGLEDSGIAPVSAINRNEQLPPTRSTQYEVGLYWPFANGSVVVSLFEIEKPYFSFDLDGRFDQLGKVTHRGVELSLAGKFLDDRLSLLVGAVALEPTVSGEAREQGLVGKRPPGERPVRVRLDSNYRTDLLGGLTPTLSVQFSSRRPISAGPLEALDGRQLYGGSATTIDLGFRLPLKLKQFPATLRGQINNITNDKQWLVIASNTLFPSDRRYVNLSLLVDF